MFRILSLDGGGARGAFIAACLAEFEKEIEGKLSDHFDLIAGTSAGGIIATLIACGVPMSAIKAIYSNHIDEVFMPMPEEAMNLSKTMDFAVSPFSKYFVGVGANELVQARYTNAGLKQIASRLMGDKRIGDIDKVRLMVNAVDLINGRPITFKTPHLPFHFRGNKRLCSDVVLATSAAPTYFNPTEIEPGSAYCDGGLWANNPGIVAFAETAHIATTCNRPEDPKFSIGDIHMLSIGTGFSHYSCRPPKEGAGFKWWARRSMEIMFDSQSQSTCFLLNRMMQERFYRINFELPNRHWAALDDFQHTPDILQYGKEEGQKHCVSVVNKFLIEPSLPYKPFLLDEQK